MSSLQDIARSLSEYRRTEAGQAFAAAIDALIAREVDTLSTAVDLEAVFRAQGALIRLKELRRLAAGV